METYKGSYWKWFFKDSTYWAWSLGLFLLFGVCFLDTKDYAAFVFLVPFLLCVILSYQHWNEMKKGTSS